MNRPLDRFAPGLLRAAWVRGGVDATAMEQHLLHGAALFADISGFSTLMERVTREGRHGVERFGRAINSYFDALIQRVTGHGGDVVSLAGDALIAYFPGDGEGAVLRAAAAASRIQRELDQLELEPGLRLSVKVAVAPGSAHLVRVGGLDGRWFSLLVGDAVDAACSALGAAAPGDVVLVGEVPADLEARDDGSGARLVAAPPVEAVPFPFARVDDGHRAALAGLVSPVVSHWAQIGADAFLGERRPIHTVFVALPPPGRATEDRVLALQERVRRVQAQVHRFGGEVGEVVADDKGWVLVAHWGLPSLSEEAGAEAAVRAAIAIDEDFGSDDLRASIGVTSGPVFCGVLGNGDRARFATYGEKVNLAARLMQHAGQGPLVDEGARAAVADRSDLRFEPTPPLSLKGFPEPVVAYRPRRGAVRGEVRGPAELVGRQAERDAFAELLARLRDGATGVLVLEGDAGLGKSVLVQALAAHARAEGVQVAHGASSPLERRTAYHAFRELLTSALDLPGAPDARAWASELPESLRERAPLLNDILPLGLPDTPFTRGLADRARSDNLHALVSELLARRFDGGPWVAFLEDAHWFDSASWALLRVLASTLRRGGIVLATRPVVAPPPELQALLALPGARQSRLERLDGASIARVVRHELGVEDLPEPLARFIVDRAEGNPFFAQQVALALRDAQQIVVDGGQVRIGGLDPDQVELPATIHGIVNARVDRLPARAQLLLKIGSVVGRVFRVDTVLSMLPGTPPTTEDATELLDGLDMVERVPGEVPTWQFGHVLTSQAVYDAMLLEQRWRMHALAFDWFSAVDAGSVAPTVLAHHAERARLWPQAVDHLEVAGANALNKAASRECLKLFSKALELCAQHGVEASPDRRAAWRWHMAEAAFRLGDMAQSIEHGERCLAELRVPMPGAWSGAWELVWRSLGWALGRSTASPIAPSDADRVLGLYGRLTDAYGFHVRVVPMTICILRALALAAREGRVGAGAQALLMLYFVLVVTPLKRRVEHWIPQVSGQLDQVEGPRLRSLLASRIAVALYYEARWDDALAHIQRGIHEANESRDLRQLTEVLCNQGFVHQAAGRLAEQERSFSEAARQAALVGDDQFRGFAVLGQADAWLWQGRPDDAHDAVEPLRAWLDTGALNATRVWGLGLVALIEERCGRGDVARGAAEAALAQVEREAFPVGWMLGGLTALGELCASRVERHGDDEAAWRALLDRCVARLAWYGKFYPFARPWVSLLKARRSGARAELERALAEASTNGLRLAEALAHQRLSRLGGPAASHHAAEAEARLGGGSRPRAEIA